MAHVTPKEIADKAYAEQRRAELAEAKMARMRELNTVDGFYQAFFKEIKPEVARPEAFEKINNEFYELYGWHRYSSYESFKRANNNRTQNRFK
jgi:hypothetical protein